MKKNKKSIIEKIYNNYAVTIKEKVVMKIMLFLFMVCIISCTDGNDNAINLSIIGDENEWKLNGLSPLDEDRWGLNGPSPLMGGFYFKDHIALYWGRIPDATGYIISYGNSTDYEYSMETSEPRVIIPGIDTKKTWYTAMQAKRGTATSPILVRHSFPASNEPSPLQLFSSSELAEKKLAWEALKITKYRTENRIEIPLLHRGSLFKSFYNLTVIPKSEPELSVVEEIGKFDGDISNHPFFQLYGKTIDELFVYIDACVAAYGTNTSFFIQYEETYHYPIHFSVSFLSAAPGGGQPTFDITAFNVLE